MLFFWRGKVLASQSYRIDMVSMARKLWYVFWSLNSASPGGNGKRPRYSALAHRSTSWREVESQSSGLESSEARQKFAGAKAISSDMFFGREVDSEVGEVVYLVATQQPELLPCLSCIRVVGHKSVLLSLTKRFPRPCLFSTTV